MTDQKRRRPYAPVRGPAIYDGWPLRVELSYSVDKLRKRGQRGAWYMPSLVFLRLPDIEEEKLISIRGCLAVRAPRQDFSGVLAENSLKNSYIANPVATFDYQFTGRVWKNYPNSLPVY